MLVKTVRQDNTKTRLVNLRVKGVTKVGIKISTVKLNVKSVTKVITKTKVVNQGVNHALLVNIKIKINRLAAKAVPKVGIKTKIDKQSAKIVTMVSILTRHTERNAKAVENFIVGTNGSRPLLLMYLGSIHVTSTNHVQMEEHGSVIVGQRVMHKGNHPVDMVIIIENAVTTSKITFVVGADCFVADVHLEMPDVIHHQKEDLG